MREPDAPKRQSARRIEGRQAEKHAWNELRVLEERERPDVTLTPALQPAPAERDVPGWPVSRGVVRVRQSAVIGVDGNVLHREHAEKSRNRPSVKPPPIANIHLGGEVR